jgi:Zn-dependent protease with chaperone function
MHYVYGIILLLFTQTTSAQLYKPYYVKAELKISASLCQKWKSTSPSVCVFEIVYNDDGVPSFAVCVRPNQLDSEILVPMSAFPYGEVKPLNSNAFWVLKAMQSGLYLQDLLASKEEIQKRNELLRNIQTANFGKFYEGKVDPYGQAYLTGILSKLVPKKIQDGRNILFRIKLSQSITPNAMAFADGTIIVSSGLLSIMSSENELIAVLAHEVAHIVLGHSLNKEIYDLKTAKLRYGEYINKLMDDYDNGIILSYREKLDLWSSIQRVWINGYSRQLELQADKIAADFLNYSGIGECYALKMFQSLKKQEDMIEGWYSNVYNDPDQANNTHPTLIERIRQLNIGPQECKNFSYDQKYNQWVSSITRNVCVDEFMWALNNTEYSTNDKLSYIIELMDSVSTRTGLTADYAILIEILCKVPGYDELVKSKLDIYKNKITMSNTLDRLISNRIFILSNLYLGNTDNFQLVESYKKILIELPDNQKIKHPFINSKQSELDWLNAL